MKKLRLILIPVLILLLLCSCTSTPAQSETTTQSGVDQAYCSITIDVTDIKDNMDLLKSEKQPFVTSDGYILKELKVEFSDGDTAFDILKKACKENACTDNCKYCKDGIQLDSKYTAEYSSYYIEGIHQLYNMDCGDMSGWLFSVNDAFAEVGASDYTVQNGDSIVFTYTCDMNAIFG